jgi:phosphoglycerol transferase MdoB-like AlkP superfamily enzyme
MTRLKKLLGPTWPVACFALFSLLVLTGSRLGLSIWHSSRVSAVDGWWPILLQGIRVDLSTLCWLWGVPLLLTVLFSGEHVVGRWWRMMLRCWLTLGLGLLLFPELATPSFIEEFGFRPNRLFVEYLIYPKEVFSMLWQGHPFELIAGVSGSIVVLIFGWWISGWVTRDLNSLRWYWRPVFAMLVVALVILGGRSTLGHRGLNPALVAFSTDPLVNSLPLNSCYSVLFAIRQLKYEEDPGRFYGTLPSERVVTLMREQSGRYTRDFVALEIPTLSRNMPSYQGNPKNLVIILEESLGARFVGALGGLPLTPNIDALRHEGWFFERLYATGTRSVRGIEAVISGFTPTPSRAVVKLDKSQSGFFTLAALLREYGYDTSFIYGGESHFDNMRSFFLGNGFSRILEQKDIENAAFVGSWGVSDEDLMQRANAEFIQLHREGKPFFSLVFSSSNHDPFEFPDGRIQLYEQPKATRNNAAKYADYAVGQFFKMARQAPYWKNTVFLVIADHESRVHGADLVPISRFHIPGLILGDGIKPRRDNRVVSQIDMGPTLLSLIGISANYPMVGRDLTQTPDDWPGRAVMQYDKNFALMEGNQVVILQPQQPAQGFLYDPVRGQLATMNQSDAFKERALSWPLWSYMAYQQRFHRLPTSSISPARLLGSQFVNTSP